MKHLIAFLAFVLCAQAYAQSNQQQTTVVAPQAAPITSQAPQKRTVIYDERTNQLVEVSPQVHTSSEATAAAPIYILNGGTQAQQVQEQPTMVVQDTPLNTSPAEAVRKQRQEAESATEDGIVQTLEKARMDDELKRRDKFNAAIAATPTPTPTPAPQVVVPVVAPVQQVQTVQPAPMAAPQAVIETPKEEKADVDNVDIKSEIRAAIAEAAPKQEAPKEQYYVAGLVGLGAYPGIDNVKNNGGAGFAVGLVTPDRWVVEGSFLYANYQLEDVYLSGADGTDPMTGLPIPWLVDMTQMNIAAAAKYQILPGKLRPSIGPVVSYTRRSYSKDGSEIETSNAVDVGLATGVDLTLTQAFSLGFDLKYYWNLTSNSSNPQSIVNRNKNNPEDLSYYQMGLAAKLMF